MRIEMMMLLLIFDRWYLILVFCLANLVSQVDMNKSKLRHTFWSSNYFILKRYFLSKNLVLVLTNLGINIKTLLKQRKYLLI